MSETPPTTPPTEPPPGPPPPPPSGPSPTGPPSGSGQNALMLVLAYLGPLALIPYLVEKDDAEVQWHAKNGLVLFGAELVLGLAFTLVNWVLPIVGCLGCFVALPLSLALLVLHVVCIVKALNGERLVIPGLTPLVDRF